MSKTFYLIDAAGMLIGQAPSAEGFLPGRCLSAPPPDHGPLDRPFWTGTGWEVRRVIEDAQPPMVDAMRPAAYPPIADQLDALWHAMDVGEIPKATAFYEMRRAVKDRYPKGVRQDVRIGHVVSPPFDPPDKERA